MKSKRKSAVSRNHNSITAAERKRSSSQKPERRTATAVAKQAEQSSQPNSVGAVFTELVKQDPEILRAWNRARADGLYQAKGRWFHLRQMLQRQAQRWRDEVGGEPPDLTSLHELEALASAIGIPRAVWERLTAGQLYDMGLEFFREVPRPRGKPSSATAEFVPTDLQRKILNALDGCAMKGQQLADAVAGRERSRLYRWQKTVWRLK